MREDAPPHPAVQAAGARIGMRARCCALFRSAPSRPQSLLRSTPWRLPAHCRQLSAATLLHPLPTALLSGPLQGQLRWIVAQKNRVRNGELYRFVADTRGAFVQVSGRQDERARSLRMCGRLHAVHACCCCCCCLRA